MLRIRIEKRRFQFSRPTKKVFFWFQICREVTVHTFYAERGDLCFLFGYGEKAIAVVFRREIKIRNK